MAESKRKARGLDDIEPAPASPAPAKRAKKKTAKKAAKKSAPKPPGKKKEPLRVPNAADYLKGLRSFKDVNEEDVAFLDDDALEVSTGVSEWLPTGSIAIDRLLGGGWPVGRIIEIAAWENVGKSTMVLQAIAMLQALGHVCMLIETETALEKKYAVSLGVDPSSLIIHKAETIEEAFVGMDRGLALQEAHIANLTKKNLMPPALVIFWDSLAGTPTEAERDGAADDDHVAVAAKRVKLNMRRLAQRIGGARACLIFTNQFYESIGQKGLKTYGGSGVRYYASVRLWLSRIQSLKVGNNVVGHVIQAKLKKTRVNIPKPPAELGLIYGAGIHNAWTLYEWGKKHGTGEKHPKWIEQGGGWNYLMFPDGTYEAFQRTFLGFAELLEKHPAVYAQMVEAYGTEQVLGGNEDE